MSVDLKVAGAHFPYLPGVDISMYQWPKGIPYSVLRELKSLGIEFIIARASIGTRTDPSALTTIQRVRDAGLVAGAYHFLDDSIPGEQQADAFWGQIEKAGGPTGIILVNDLEVVAGNVPTAKQGRAWATRMGSLAGTRTPLTLYTNRSSAVRIGNPDFNGLYDNLWQALWTQSETLERGLSLPLHAPRAGFLGFRDAPLWQYGPCKFTFRGKRHSIDGNAFYGTRAELESLANVKRPPLPDRPNYRVGYEAARSAIEDAIKGLTQPQLPAGPAAPAGWDEALADGLAAIDDIKLGG